MMMKLRLVPKEEIVLDSLDLFQPISLCILTVGIGASILSLAYKRRNLKLIWFHYYSRTLTAATASNTTTTTDETASTGNFLEKKNPEMSSPQHHILMKGNMISFLLYPLFIVVRVMEIAHRSLVEAFNLSAENENLRLQLLKSRSINRRLECKLKNLEKRKDALLDKVKMLKSECKVERGARFVVDQCYNEKLKKLEMELDFRDNELIHLQRKLDAMEDYDNIGNLSELSINHNEESVKGSYGIHYDHDYHSNNISPLSMAFAFDGAPISPDGSDELEFGDDDDDDALGFQYENSSTYHLSFSSINFFAGYCISNDGLNPFFIN